MRNFYVITNRNRDRNLAVTNRIRNYLVQHDRVVKVSADGPMEDGHYTDSTHIPEETECIIVIGGDGTLIAAARDIVDTGLPMLGVNQGTLGYLTDVEVDSLEHSLDRLIDGRFEIEERMMLCGQVSDPTGKLMAESRALNDVVLHAAGALHLGEYEVSVNGRYLSSFRADGIIVCTPTGSTAYSMSAGGPIIEPRARMMVITPICPHTLNTRSIVLSADDTVSVSVKEGASVACFDGHSPVDLNKGDIVDIRRSAKVTRIIRINTGSFISLLSNRLRS